MAFEDNRRPFDRGWRAFVIDLQLEVFTPGQGPTQRDPDDLRVQPPPFHCLALDLDIGNGIHGMKPKSEGGHVVGQGIDRHRVAAAEVLRGRVDLEVETVMKNVSLSGQRIVAALEPQRLGLSGIVGTRSLHPLAAVELILPSG